MSNFFQCPTCGSPNDSTSKCAYCGNYFSDTSTLVVSKTDKGTFDLAIYEIENNLTKALLLFDEIIKIDPLNYIAWLYKYSCEL